MGLFSKRKLNQNASAKPKFVADYYPTSTAYVGIDSTAFACIDRIASEFAALNFGIYKTSDKQKVKNHSMYAVLKEPNLDERHYNFFYQSAIDYFNGGCFWLVRRYDGEVVSLFRMNPSEVKIARNQHSNKREFYYKGSVFTQRDVVFIPSRFNYNSLSGGMSIFDAVHSVFDTSQSIESYTQSSFTKGLLGKRIVIDVEGAFPNLDADTSKEIKDNFQKEYGGVNNAGRPILKKKGFEYSELGSVGTDNNATQLSENRKFQEREIAKVFGVPVELLNGFQDKSNLENTFVMFNEFALRPMASQFQEAINTLLDEQHYYFEFDYNGVMKVSLQQRIDAYSKQINNGLLSPNEARAKENLSPIEAGDNHFMPVNMMPLNDQTIEAYMAKQKNEIANGKDNSNPTDENAQHFGGGDDKQ